MDWPKANSRRSNEVIDNFKTNPKGDEFFRPIPSLLLLELAVASPSSSRLGLGRNNSPPGPGELAGRP